MKWSTRRPLRHHGAAAPVLCALCLGCSEPASEAPGPAPVVPEPSAAPFRDAGPAEVPEDSGSIGQWTPDPLAGHCGPAPVRVSPQSISEVVQAINQFEKPVTLGCFLRSLARPLHMQASSSFVSFQPASGKRSPRMFIFNGPLVMTVVPTGTGSELLEMGEFVTGTRTLKAELHFPIKEPLSSSAPYAALTDSQGTSCRGCHAAEEASETVPGAFVSDALKPAAHELVPLPNLALEAEACDVYAEANRCAILHGAFAYGAVHHQDFPEEVRIFQ